MYAQFPFDFKLHIKYNLVKNTIKTEYLVENKGEETMPFFIGGHPGFNCPLFENEKYEDYTVVFEEKENCSVPTPVTETGLIDVEHRMPFFENENRLNLKHELFAEDAIIFDELKSRSVHLVSKNHNKSIQLYFEQFPYSFCGPQPIMVHLLRWSHGLAYRPAVMRGMYSKKKEMYSM